MVIMKHLNIINTKKNTLFIIILYGNDYFNNIIFATKK